jgi:hypothetical protein
VHLLEGLRGHLLAFASSKRLISWAHLPSQQWLAESLSHCHLWFSHSPPSYAQKDSWDYAEPIQITQDSLIISKSTEVKT